jgi:2-amino-4-hydroxy-6-hydroxymethyldihydropteridine diphosphokinase
MAHGFATMNAPYPAVSFIGLGANLGDPQRQIKEALVRLMATEEVEVHRVSSLYLNPPMGPAPQPWYINAAARIRTRLSPEGLLQVLHQVETAMGRARRERWGPRLIDLDLLLYDGVISAGPGLVLPHPEMHQRAFVLVPLAEIAPEAWHPVLKKSAAELLAALDPAAREALRPLR